MMIGRENQYLGKLGSSKSPDGLGEVEVVPPADGGYTGGCLEPFIITVFND